MKAVLSGAGALLALGAGMALAQVPGENFLINWDADGDGVVTRAEARARRADIFFAFDADENGKLEGAELSALSETREATRPPEAGPKGNGHGQGMGRGRAGGGSPSGTGRRAHADNGMTPFFNDTDGDGAVSRAAFLDRTDAWLARMDRDGDGVVTAADFGPPRD